MLFIYGLATVGLWVFSMVPFLGTAFFLAGLLVWMIPGIALEWTGHFEYHEFGASPVGWEGYLLMFLFYLAIAVVISLPFRGRKQD